MKDKRKFSEFLTGLGEIFDKEITKTLNKVYWECLKPYTDQECEIAFTKTIANCKFFPRPAEIIENIPKTNAFNAWGVVIDALERGEEPQNYAIQETIRRLGGWSWLTRQTYDELVWVEKRFYEYLEVINETPEIALGYYNETKLLQ